MRSSARYRHSAVTSGSHIPALYRGHYCTHYTAWHIWQNTEAAVCGVMPVAAIMPAFLAVIYRHYIGITSAPPIVARLPYLLKTLLSSVLLPPSPELRAGPGFPFVDTRRLAGRACPPPKLPPKEPYIPTHPRLLQRSSKSSLTGGWEVGGEGREETTVGEGGGRKG